MLHFKKWIDMYKWIEIRYNNVLNSHLPLNLSIISPVKCTFPYYIYFGVINIV